MFLETGKKFIESFSEIKNQKSVVLLHRNVADDVLFQEHFTDLDHLEWFPDTKDFVSSRYL